MRILVTGANGQLGREMRIIAQSTADTYIFSDISAIEGLPTMPLDITDPEAVRNAVQDNNIDIIVNCAAYTDVEGAETREALAEKLNADAPAILADAIKQRGGLLIHISTDYVFGAEPYNVPCKETQTGTPTGAYGRTKLHGEQKILASGCQYIIIRTAWLYSEFGKNFCLTMLRLTAEKPRLSVVFDQAGTPTYALDLANAISAIIDDYRQSAPATGNAPEIEKTFATTGTPEAGNALAIGNAPEATDAPAKYAKTGIYHYSNEGVCSWYDFTKMIQHFSGNTDCDVQPCHSDQFPSTVTRPSYSVLDKTLIKETFGIKVPYWTDSLQTCISNIKASPKTQNPNAQSESSLALQENAAKQAADSPRTTSKQQAK